MRKINHRKLEHIRICLTEEVEAGSPGFEKVRLAHDALPELDFDEIDTSCEFLGKTLDSPIIIEALTGGADESKEINQDIARVAQKLNVGFSVGSQRAAIEDAALEQTYKVRDVAPDIFLIANLGAVQLNYGLGVAECERAVEMISADAIALHVNPLQELIQAEGNRNFKGLVGKINGVAKKIKSPVILKEVGCGISRETARKLKVSAYDVGGLGGTNWALVEGIRSGRQDTGRVFSTWGIPTVESVIELSGLEKPVIASGGVRSGLDAAKAIALGASCVGIALPVLKAWEEGRTKGVECYLERIVEELKISMFLSGARKIGDLSGKASLN